MVQGQSGPTRVFTVRNVGGQNLVLGTPSLPAGFSLVEGLAANIAPGGSDTFTGRLDSAAVGTKSGEVTFTTNDLDENPFNFAIAGQVTLPPPEIAVELSGADIPDGSSTAIDFGSVALGQPGPTRVFTVRNTGGADLRQPDRHECRRDGGICEQFERSQARPITASAPTATAWATRPKAT
ncbi:MAG: choice-of-anchor D domain-containing protein [Planctomycetes bacterium]|nr:choice-of-anchor D domain-containing protein [Planctomycetota bacterium]